MDMIMKNRFGLENKKTQIVSSLIQIFVLVLAVFVMMVGVGYAGPTYNPFLTHPDSNNMIAQDTNVTALADSTVLAPETKNKSASNPNDTWNGSFGYTSSNYDGTYIGTFIKNGNPSYIQLQELISLFLGLGTESTFFEGYGKIDWDEDDDDWDETTLDTRGGVTGLTAEKNSGTWEVTTSDSNISFYGIKKSGGFALYYIEGGATFGQYTTVHVPPNYVETEVPSNLFVVKTPPSVPEPATMLLFGFSLIGLAGMARRRNSKF